VEVHVLASQLDQPLLQSMLLDRIIHPTWPCVKCEGTTGFRCASYLYDVECLSKAYDEHGLICNSGRRLVREKFIEWGAHADWTGVAEQSPQRIFQVPVLAAMQRELSDKKRDLSASEERTGVKASRPYDEVVIKKKKEVDKSLSELSTTIYLIDR
jgi:hypothetical protein